MFCSKKMPVLTERDVLESAEYLPDLVRHRVRHSSVPWLNRSYSPYKNDKS